ncbi:hypothetical protein [Paenibacillus eucommiae]|uniref:Glycosyl hydrolase family 32 N-terminal domain-containing protein n=1 Tax=Paenibacillus eucommiae TaxID=1355755 RepID=A0ABS4IRC6_9BACL|nr:hypothetical protein [Paenibacillus eucommiae]MBP1990113.1 hypothetical protein [Paenibacillus eucommiae]
MKDEKRIHMPKTEQSAFYFPGIGKHVNDNAVLFAIDNGLLPFRKNLCLYYTKPKVHHEPVIRPSEQVNAPDASAAMFYGTVLFDEGKYRIWYCGLSLGLNPDMPIEDLNAAKASNLDVVVMGPICYAESEDGIHWVKPNLRQLQFKGSMDNNALNLPDAIVHCPTIIKDEDDPDPNRRYKMVYQYFLHTDHAQGWGTMRTATSPNGIDWVAGPREKVFEFVEHAAFYKFNDLYIVNTHKNSHWNRGEGGSHSGRQGYVFISSDFENWLEESAESFALPEPHDPKQRGVYKSYDQMHLGTAAAVYNTTAIGLYCMWHNNEDFSKISGDLGIVVSNDGIRFHEPYKGHIYLGKEDSPVTPIANKHFPTVLLQSNGFLNVGDETRIYHGRWRNVGTFPYEEKTGYYGEIAFASIPRDRWGALGLYPEEAKGSLWSVTMIVPDEDWELLLNAEGAQGMRVEISDEKFHLIPQFSGANSGFLELDNGFECPVTWPQGSLRKLAGQSIRLRLHLERTNNSEPRIYALYLKKTKKS